MRADDLRNLARRLAKADRLAERDVLSESLELLGANAQSGQAQWRNLLRLGAVNDVAIGTFRAALSQYGFQIGVLPGGRAMAQIWRDADANTRVYTAATPALALMQAFADESAKRIDDDRATHCPSCRGIGWTITSQNTKAVCHHTAGLL